MNSSVCMLYPCIQSLLLGHPFRFSVTGTAILKPVPVLAKDTNNGSVIEQDKEYRAAIKSLKGANILLVEDNVLNQQLSLALLESNGLSADLAEDGEQAIEMIQNNSYDCVLMDCQMPVLNGYEATRKIRSQPRFDKLPIIALSANVMRGDFDRAIECGMNDYIFKPIDIKILFVTIARWLG